MHKENIYRLIAFILCRKIDDNNNSVFYTKPQLVYTNQVSCVRLTLHRQKQET